MATSFKAVSNARTNDRDGNGITSQVVGEQRGLDVNVIGGDITIDNAEINVELDAEDGDNVAIHSSSTGDELIIHPDGSTDVNVIDSVLPDGAATEATLLLAAASLTNLDTWEVSGLPAGDNNIGNVDVVSSVLPTGAATEAKQDTGNAALSSIDSKITTTANGIRVDAIISDGSGPVTVDGTVTANQGTPAAISGRWPVQITDGTDLALVTASGEQNVIATAQPGVDIGDVTVNNALGTTAVPIQGAEVIGATVSNSIAGVKLAGGAQGTGTIESVFTKFNGLKVVLGAGDASTLLPTNFFDGLFVSTAYADNTAFFDGSTKVFAAGFIFDETAGTALTENDQAAARIDSKRAQVLVIEDETTRGRRATVTAANALKVDGSAVTQPISVAQTATTISTDTEVSVTGSSTQLLAANSSRKKVFIQNHGTGYVRVRLAATALVTSPIRLVPEVGTYELKSEDGFVYRGVINAISETGTNLVGVIEET